MFWDNVAFAYDFFENTYNGKVYANTGKTVAEQIEADDEVLECACGTGAISVYIAPKCKHLTATDFSQKMLKKTTKKLQKFSNVEIKSLDMTNIDYPDNSFDKVVAGNVIHLLDNPVAVISELVRVCKTNGKVVIPTYINIYEDGKESILVKIFEKAGANFKKQFDLESYKTFFKNAGYEKVEYHVVEGKMPCAVAVITKSNK
ncbi:MAG: class I SAM-dependent methyltransferase [Bacteroidales bacterium]|nr:class I SAM-dependent methyltransferase [Bacteroidales bacterium]